MKTIYKPQKEQWDEFCMRPLINAKQLNKKVGRILEEVKQNGDQALIKYTKEFDGVALKKLSVSTHELTEATSLVPEELKMAIQMAYKNIRAFHNAQNIEEEIIETSPGVKCWRKSHAIEKVGLYIPGGSAPLFSTILMTGIPANIAGCQQVVLCTPPGEHGKINPAILYTAQIVGITKIYKVGGAQAIAAMAYGTKSIPKVFKIFGPGNQYVTKAKELVMQEGMAIDLPAGPSELLLIADDSCNPAFVAADLLSQAEHGADSQVILLSDNQSLINACMEEMAIQLKALPRKDIARKALQNSWGIVLDNMQECIEFSNTYAPEHLIIASEKAQELANGISNAGSVFLGNYSCESAGDYASGTNHTLPTNGYAKNYSGVSLDSFVKKISYQSIDKRGISQIGKAIEIMANAEQLYAHKNAVSIRLKSISNV